MTISYHFPLVMLAGSANSSSEVNREVYLHSIPADARAAVQKHLRRVGSIDVIN
jgi:hypothetical protein